MGASWSTVELDVPDLAVAVRSRFAANRHHVLATIRHDGAPRLSGTEVVIDDEVRLGMMTGAHKLGDIARDPRVELHCAPIEEDLTAGDARLSGRLREDGPTKGVDGFQFVLDIDKVILTQVRGDELVLTVWDADEGTRVLRRT